MNDSLGIDIGLDTIKLGYWDNDRVWIFDDYVEASMTLKGDNIFSRKYNKYAINSLKYTIYDINKIIGINYNDEVLQENMKNWPFKIEKDLNTDKPLIVIEYENKIKKYYPEEIMMMLFDYVKRFFLGNYGRYMYNVVLTVPLYFNESQKKAYINSAKNAGLNVLKLIKTTSASALTYYDYHFNQYKNNKTKKNILIFDFGITLELSIFSIDENLIEEKSSYYDINCGGDFILNELVELCINEFKEEIGIDIHNNEKAIIKLKEQCKDAIEYLSHNLECSLSIDNLYQNYDFNTTIRRYELNINSEKIIKSIKIVIEKAKLKKENIDDIFFTGKLSINPEIKDCVLRFFNKEINYKKVEYEGAAYGAVIQLSIINKKYYNNNLTLLELDFSNDDLTKQNTNLNEILQYFLIKLNKEMIDLKNEIDEYEDLESNEAKMLKNELDEKIKKDNNDLESIIICEELIEEVKNWINKMKTIKFEKKNLLLEKELIQCKDEKIKIEKEKNECERNYKLCKDEKIQIERNYKLIIEKFKEIEKEKNEYERNYKLCKDEKIKIEKEKNECERNYKLIVEKFKEKSNKKK